MLNEGPKVKVCPTGPNASPETGKRWGILVSALVLMHHRGGKKEEKNSESTAFFEHRSNGSPFPHHLLTEFVVSCYPGISTIGLHIKYHSSKENG